MSYYAEREAFVKLTSNMAISARASSKSHPKSACVTPAWHRISLPATPKSDSLITSWTWTIQIIVNESHRTGSRVYRMTECITASQMTMHTHLVHVWWYLFMWSLFQTLNCWLSESKFVWYWEYGRIARTMQKESFCNGSRPIEISVYRDLPVSLTCWRDTHVLNIQWHFTISAFCDIRPLTTHRLHTLKSASTAISKCSLSISWG